MNYLSNKIYSTIFNQQADFTAVPISTVNHALKSLRYLGPKIGNVIPHDIRNSGNIPEFMRKLNVGFPKIILVSYFLITSIALGVTISHIFGTSHLVVLWQIERAFILARDFTMAASTLKCHP